MSFALKNTTDLKPRVQFDKIAQTILGVRYDLSLLLCGDTLGRRLNIEYKKHEGPTNVLSFPYDKTSGEIIINVRRAERDAKHFDHTFTEHVAYLFIHACLHLTGHTHGKNMERLEQTYMRKFKDHM